MAQIDALTSSDRALVRRASVFGLTFHPRMLEWLTGDGDFAPPDPAVWGRLGELFDEEPDGYLRFRRSLLRDAAYQGLPFKLRRQLHRFEVLTSAIWEVQEATRPAPAEGPRVW